MKPYVINKNSWHYKMISKGQHWDGYLSHRAPKDFCSYWRKVISKVLGIMFVVAMATTFVVFFGYNIYLDPIPVIGGIFSAIVLLAGTLFTAIGIDKLKEKKRKRDYKVEFEGKQEGLIAMKYRSWKEKTCPMVEFK